MMAPERGAWSKPKVLAPTRSGAIDGMLAAKGRDQMSFTIKTLRIATLAVGAVLLTAAAATAGPLSGAGSASKSLDSGGVTQVHGWHRYCDWGPQTFHRHVPGYGRVICGGGPGHGPRHGPSLQFRIGPKPDHSCKGVKFMCADRWGWGTWKFENCMAKRGC